MSFVYDPDFRFIFNSNIIRECDVKFRKKCPNNNNTALITQMSLLDTALRKPKQKFPQNFSVWILFMDDNLTFDGEGADSVQLFQNYFHSQN